MVRTQIIVRSLAAVLVCLAAAEARAEQTIVFFRHGEKPSGGYGQLTCQGLNRALALPDVLIPRFGKGTHFYAPNPNVKINDPVGSQYYVRPLATIEPMAIRSGVGVNTRYGYNDVNGLLSMLITPTKADSRIYVAWEHAYLVKAVQAIMNAYGGGAPVPGWTYGDYDSLYIVHVTYSGSTITARFEREFEGLNGQPTACP
jgi:hypothetical protein